VRKKKGCSYVHGPFIPMELCTRMYAYAHMYVHVRTMVESGWPCPWEGSVRCAGGAQGVLRTIDSRNS